jgi:flagellin
MSGIVLSSAVRQNLLSLQSTATLLATTQNDLATGNKVNSPIDNPTDYFTAQSLVSRAGDIGNLLDSIGTGVQVLQAANTGITSLQGLISNGQSIANQVLQTPVGYSTKANFVSAAITGGTAQDLLGTATVSAGTYTGTVIANKTTLTVTNVGTALTTGGGGSDSILAQPAEGSTLVINGQTITFTQLSPTTAPSATGNTLNLNTTHFSDLIASINAIAGAGTASLNSSGELVLNSGTGAGLTVGGTALATFGLSSGGTSSNLSASVTSISSGGTTLTGASAVALQGETLTIGATGGGTATNITFGTGSTQISTLNQLNTALAANNLQATIDSSSGKINIVTSNDAASSSIGALGGTAVTTSGAAFSSSSAAAPVADPDSQATRASLVAQYNDVLDQINATAGDSSFNGVNLLNGDTLKLVFNETGTSTLSITGATFNDAGLSLSKLTEGTNFLDNSSADTVLSQLQNAATTLRAEATALGSNLSIVGIRQDFDKNMIDVLQTGASNLTLADPNQEAANSQALSTRQEIAVSALALANQSQRSVLQLLR